MDNNELSLEETFIQGSNNQCNGLGNDDSKPLVVRGVIKKHHIDHCISIGRDFYYIDTGYVGNFPSVGNPGGKKLWHRVVKNENQHCVIRDVPSDRWKNLVKQDPRLTWNGWKNHNKKILLVLPNPKACRYYNLDYDTWITETTEKIKTYSNLPIEVRVKGARSYRNLEYSIYDAFDSGVYATVAMNSIAALESVLYGIPAFVSVSCAASPLACNDLSQLANPYRPSDDIIKQQSHNIAYGQFTQEELLNGTAWKITQQY
jgi:hypothetical protein